MTNGEKIVQLFPNAQVDQGETRIYVWLDHSSTTFDREWWNAEYKEPQTFKWCADCKEYDTEKHCCHRYSKVIRDAVAEIEQEPVLDKIRTELHATAELHEDGGYCIRDEWIDEYFDKYKTESEE